MSGKHAWIGAARRNEYAVIRTGQKSQWPLSFIRIWFDQHKVLQMEPIR